MFGLDDILEFGGAVGSVLGDMFSDTVDAVQPFMPSIAPIASAAVAKSAQEDTNAQNVQLAQQNNAFNAGQASLNREFQSGEAALNRQFQSDQVTQQVGFQERMSNTAYQRSVQDLQAAGLNPMLSLMKGGASSPSGGSASGSMPSGSAASGTPAHLENSVAAGMNSGFRAAELAAALDRQEADTDLSRAQAELVRSQVPKVQQDVETSKASAGQLVADTARLRDELMNMRFQRNKLDEEAQKITSERRQIDFVVDNILPLDKKILLSEEELKRLELPGARNRASAEGTKYAKDFSTSIRRPLEDLKSLSSVAGDVAGVGRDVAISRMKLPKGVRR